MKRNGQALAELAIFGSIMLLALGALVRFGLQQMYSQQTSQEAFRLALQRAHGADASGSGNVQIAHDWYIPDPSRPFSVGSRSLSVGGGSVQWTTTEGMDIVGTYEELPKMEIRSNGVSRVLTTAGLLAYNTPLNASGNYGRAYRALVRVFCDRDADSDGEYEDCEIPLRYGTRRITDGFVETQAGYPVRVVNPPATESTHQRWTVIILDSCAGQMADAETCAIQCDHMRGIYYRHNGTIRQRNPVLDPLPGYCAQFEVNESPGGSDPTSVNEDMVHRTPHGLDLRNSRKHLLINNKLRVFDANTAAIQVDEEERIQQRVLRYQDPDADFAQQSEDLAAQNPARHRFIRRSNQTWTTP